jgi:hypothetical protein
LGSYFEATHRKGDPQIAIQFVEATFKEAAMSLIIAICLFILSFALLAKIESMTQVYIAMGMILTGVVLTFLFFYTPNPSKKKLRDLGEDIEFFEAKQKQARKKGKEILEQAELAKQEGQSRRDGDEVVTVVKYGDEYREERRPLKKFER